MSLASSPIALVLVLALGLGLATTGCGAKKGAPAGAGSGACVARMGLITNLQTSTGRELARALELGRDEINASGGVAGCKIELTVKSDDAEDGKARATARELLDLPGLWALFGTDNSATTITVMDAAERAQVPFLVPATSSALAGAPGHAWAFRFAAPDYALVAGLFDFLTPLVPTLGLRSIAVVYPHTASSLGRFVNVQDEARARGLAVVVAEEYGRGTTDFRRQLTQVKWASPDVVILDADHAGPHDDLRALLEQARELDLSPKLFLTTSNILGDSSAAGLDYVVSSAQWTEDAPWRDEQKRGGADFRKAYSARFGDAPGFRAVSAYVALQVVRRALEGSKGSGAPDWSSPAAIRARLRDGLRATDLRDTLFGPIRFDASGQNDHPVLVAQVQGMTRTLVHPALGGGAAGRLAAPVPPWKERP